VTISWELPQSKNDADTSRSTCGSSDISLVGYNNLGVSEEVSEWSNQ